MNDKSFNYENLVLTLNSEDSNEKPINFTCKAIKLTGEKYTIQCNLDNAIKANLDGAFSDLGNANLVINFIDNINGTIDFKSDNIEDVEPNETNSAIQGIVSVVVACVAVLAVTTSLIICLR